VSEEKSSVETMVFTLLRILFVVARISSLDDGIKNARRHASLSAIHWHAHLAFFF
jgi:hypothetical protein